MSIRLLYLIFIRLCGYPANRRLVRPPAPCAARYPIVSLTCGSAAADLMR